MSTRRPPARGRPLRRRGPMSATEAPVSPARLLPPPLTEEDAARSEDRSRVHLARGHRRRWYLLWLLVGPGILAMIGENDGPSMIAYAADGAEYGLGFFVPFIPILFAMAYVCQEMCRGVGRLPNGALGGPSCRRNAKVGGGLGQAI